MKQKRNKILSIIQILTGIITIMIGIATTVLVKNFYINSKHKTEEKNVEK